MKLAKDGQTITLTNQAHIDAYLNSGWVEVKEFEKVKKITKEQTPKKTS